MDAEGGRGVSNSIPLTKKLPIQRWIAYPPPIEEFKQRRILVIPPIIPHVLELTSHISTLLKDKIISYQIIKELEYW